MVIRKKYPEINFKEVGQRIKNLRGELSQKKLVLLLGKDSQSYLCEIETARTKPSIDILYKISRFSGVSIDFILTGKACNANAYELRLASSK